MMDNMANIIFKNKTFVVHESVHYNNKPYDTGMSRAIILYQNMLYRNSEPLSGPPNANSIQYWTDTLQNLNYKGLLVLDIEHWPIYTDTVSRQYMIDVVEAFKIFGRTYEVGYYSMIPQRNHIDSLFPGSQGYINWKLRNDFVKPIVELHTDVIYPSLYTLYTDYGRWERYAVENMLEARRMHPTKKIIPILWPQYHDSLGQYALQYIDPDFWYQQLMTVYRYTDNVLIWKGVNKEEWSETIPWLQVTREFMNKYATQ